MKKNLHPELRYVIFRDTSADKDFRMLSTMQSDQTVVWKDGETYPLVMLDVSSESHPYYTGRERDVTAESRVAQFQRRYGKAG